MATNQPAASDRFPAIDFVKAAAIVAVVFTHAALPQWHPRHTTLDFLLGDLWISFHVPSFLILSGFLYCRGRPVSWAEVGRRFSRFLIPYLLASAIVQAGGLSNAKGLGDVAYQVLTGSSLGIYYYLFQLAVCTVFVWPLSRLSPRVVGLLLVVLYIYGIAATALPELVFNTSFFWAIRNPLYLFLAYFVSGWLGALVFPQVERLYRTRKGLVVVGSALGVGVWLLENLWGEPVLGSLRVAYILGAFGLIVCASTGRHVGRVVGFLSEATLGLYLYHDVFILLAQPHVMGWPPLARILTLVAVGLLGGAGTCLLARRLLGRSRARTLFGA